MGKSLLHRPETAVDVFKLLPEGVYCQVIDNIIYMSPSPTFDHQDVISDIHYAFKALLKSKKSGKCVAAPIDVFLDNRNAFQPDLVYLSNENLKLIGTDRKIHGAPDIVVEVLSPGNQNDDKYKKKNAYEKNGVGEYFIVEPKSKQVITYYLVDGKYVQQTKNKGKIVSLKLKKTFKF
jgi:Uma2 family endonuclease